jgi:hypothetical protein
MEQNTCHTRIFREEGRWSENDLHGFDGLVYRRGFPVSITYFDRPRRQAGEKRVGEDQR